MDRKLVSILKKTTKEERRILKGDNFIEKGIYAEGKEFVVDSKKMLQKGKLIDIRTHTRFVSFPKHKHNYVEIIYMCSGSTTHIINDNHTVTLEKGDLLFLNQNAFHEIMPAQKEDIAINFIILPEFFDVAFTFMKEDNVLQDFIVESLRRDSGKESYLHFKVSDILPIQNLIENMIWSIMNKQNNNGQINQTSMGLLFLYLLNYTDKMEQGNKNAKQSNIVVSVLRYIENNYKNASLTEISIFEHISIYQLSKLIKIETGHTYKELLQMKRFNKAIDLLTNTKLSISDIILAVGYDNTSYFHKAFKQKYGVTPKQYRDSLLQ